MTEGVLFARVCVCMRVCVRESERANGEGQREKREPLEMKIGGRAGGIWNMKNKLSKVESNHSMAR